ncbi:unnamed protein product [Caenorhabditis angaria]|uniref:Uncharacterized protein n=1 Tax=Caenorhabditis angaria TaxID=860376 RepID=A0A9P1IRE6_9PELO|nr:unnamed protein product [Caenorhabditis angaria]
MDVLDRVIINWRTILRLLIKQMKRGFNTDIKNRAASRDINDEQLNKASTSSSPVSDDSNILAVPINGNNNMSQSLTLPVINVNYRKMSDSRSTPGDDRQTTAQSTGFLRPLKEFARKKFINHW